MAMNQQNVEDIFRREMLRLRPDYLTGSLGVIEIMRGLLSNHVPPQVPVHILDRLIGLTRRLRGSGRTYDLPELTDWATFFEDELRTVRRRGGQLTPERHRSLLSVVGKLGSILQAEQSVGSRQ